MAVIRWTWTEGHERQEHDWEVSDRETLYNHLHQSYVEGHLNKEEHLYLLQQYNLYLHTPLSELDENLCPGNMLTLAFPSDEDHDLIEETSVNGEVLGETQNAEEVSEDDTFEQKATPQATLETSPADPSNQHESEEKNGKIHASTEKSNQPKTFSWGKNFDPQNIVNQYKHTYRQEFYCTQTSRQWVAIIGGDEELLPTNDNDAGKAESDSVNLCFLIDTSGSMNKWIVGVRKQCQQIARGITEATNEEPSIMLAGYGIGDAKSKEKLWMSQSATVIDGGQQNRIYNIVHWPFLSIEQFQPLVDEFRLGTAGRRGCFFAGEDTYWVMDYLCSLLTKSGKNIIIHISDEYDKSGENTDLEKICTLLAKRNDITLFTLGKPVDGHVKPTKISGGKFWDISEKDVDVDDILKKVQSEIQSMLQFDNSNLSTGTYYTQYDSAPFSGKKSSVSSIQVNAQNVAGSFDGILSMSCHYCESQKYAKCGGCGAHMCVTPNQTELQCEACGLVMPITKSSIVSGKGQNNASSKGK